MIGEYLRGINALAGAVVFVLLVARVMLVWKQYSYAQKMVFVSQVLYVIATTYGSIELIITNAPWSWRILIILAANTCMFIYLAEPERRYRARLGKDVLRPEREQK